MRCFVGGCLVLKVVLKSIVEAESLVEGSTIELREWATYSRAGSQSPLGRRARDPPAGCAVCALFKMTLLRRLFPVKEQKYLSSLVASAKAQKHRNSRLLVEPDLG